jgi:hypothetical protein
MNSFFIYTFFVRSVVCHLRAAKRQIGFCVWSVWYGEKFARDYRFGGLKAHFLKNIILFLKFEYSK